MNHDPLLRLIPSLDTGKDDEGSTSKSENIKFQDQIINLSKALRSNCDKILSNNITFNINLELLLETLQAIQDVDLKLHEECESNPNLNDYENNILFISDFFKQTPSLSIVRRKLININQKQSPKEEIEVKKGIEPGSINLILFESLKTLQLYKINNIYLAGFNNLRLHLKKLQLLKGVNDLTDLFPTNSESSSIWPQLKELDLSHNRIRLIDSNAFETTPYLEILNLSHNHITNIDPGLNGVLNSLTILNLNYNQLTSIPTLPPNIKVLLLSHNFISSLFNGYSLGCSLECLDLSNNTISDINSIGQLRELTCLKSVAFTGNPISYLKKYRLEICLNLNRSVVNSKFKLDGIKLNNSEISKAFDGTKKQNVPIFIGPVSTTSALRVGKPNPFTNSQLTQSYDSESSSSFKSSTIVRKKPRTIREIVLLDNTDKTVANENDKFKYSYSNRRNSSSSTETIESIGPIVTPEASSIKEAINNLILKHGQDNWLLKQSGNEVKKLCNINEPSYPTIKQDYNSLSKSMPVKTAAVEADTTSYYSTIEELDTSIELNTASKISDSSTASTIKFDKENYHRSNSEDSDLESIHRVDESSHNSSDSLLFYSCFDNVDQDSTVASLNPDNFVTDKFNDSTGTAIKFRTFQNGQMYQLIIYENYLYEVDSNNDSLILNKWDCKSIKEINIIKTDSETETLEFKLSFDTLRRNLRERNFIMPKTDFNRFETETSKYYKQNILHEFDSYSCCRCGSVFTKTMAVSSVIKVGKVPKTISVCPYCDSELIVELESIPLPNNETFEIEKETEEPRPMSSQEWNVDNKLIRSSTPINENNSSSTAGAKGKSLPSGNGFHLYQRSRDVPGFKHGQSNITTTRDDTYQPDDGSNTRSRMCSSPKSAFNENNILTPANATNKYSHSVSSNNTTNSDIETLSCDSSSIEVLNRNPGTSEDSGSANDINIEEGVEILIPDYNAIIGKIAHANSTVPSQPVSQSESIIMIESNSSGSCAGSICTQYENTINAGQQVAQHQKRLPIPKAFMQSSSNSGITNQLSTSPKNSQNQTKLHVPIKYDYENYTKIDHRLQLFIELSVFTKYEDEELLALAKVLMLTQPTSGNSAVPFPSVIIFSNHKIYIYKITGIETDHPSEWLTKFKTYPINKLSKFDVLIGRHSIGLDLSSIGKYYALLFLDFKRTSSFIEHSLGEICMKLNPPILVQDFSTVHKALMSPVNPIEYFGLLKHVTCEYDGRHYNTSAIVLTNKELILVTDISWLVNRSGTGTESSIVARYEQNLTTLKQVESLELNATYIKLVFDTSGNGTVAAGPTSWELYFETSVETDTFINWLRLIESNDINFIILSQPIQL